MDRGWQYHLLAQLHKQARPHFYTERRQPKSSCHPQRTLNCPRVVQDDLCTPIRAHLAAVTDELLLSLETGCGRGRTDVRGTCDGCWTALLRTRCCLAVCVPQDWKAVSPVLWRGAEAWVMNGVASVHSNVSFNAERTNMSGLSTTKTWRPLRVAISCSGKRFFSLYNTMWLKRSVDVSYGRGSRWPQHY